MATVTVPVSRLCGGRPSDSAGRLSWLQLEGCQAGCRADSDLTPPDCRADSDLLGLRVADSELEVRVRVLNSCPAGLAESPVILLRVSGRAAGPAALPVRDSPDSAARLGACELELWIPG